MPEVDALSHGSRLTLFRVSLNNYMITQLYEPDAYQCGSVVEQPIPQAK